MPRASRYYLPGHVWHLTHRCHKREFRLKFARFVLHLMIMAACAQLCHAAAGESFDLPGEDEILPGVARSLAVLPRKPYEPASEASLPIVRAFRNSREWISRVLDPSIVEGPLEVSAYISEDGVQFTEAILELPEYTVTIRQSPWMMTLHFAPVADASEIKTQEELRRQIREVVGRYFRDDGIRFGKGGARLPVSDIRRGILGRLEATDPVPIRGGYAFAVKNTDLAYLDDSLAKGGDDTAHYWYKLVNYWTAGSHLNFYFLRLEGVPKYYVSFTLGRDYQWFGR